MRFFPFQSMISALFVLVAPAMVDASSVARLIDRTLTASRVAMSSKGSKGPKASKTGDLSVNRTHSCFSIALYVLDNDINGASSPNAIGSTIDALPVYSNTTNEIIGTFSASTVRLSDLRVVVKSSTRVPESYLTGTFTFFDENNSTIGTLSIAATATGVNGAITGGTGVYSCASGYESLLGRDSGVKEVRERIEGELVICGNPCEA